MAIVELPARCWFVATSDGEPFDPMDEGCPHYTTEAEVREAVTNLSEAYEGLTVGLLPHACIEVTCNAGCPDARFENYDTGGFVHFPDLDTALSMLRADDWVIGFNNACWHADCAPGVRR
jgi:heterodisulfide reductase subunit C